jgi:hypothetical protein
MAGVANFGPVGYDAQGQPLAVGDAVRLVDIAETHLYSLGVVQGPADKRNAVFVLFGDHALEVWPTAALERIARPVA